MGKKDWPEIEPPSTQSATLTRRKRIVRASKIHACSCTTDTVQTLGTSPTAPFNIPAALKGLTFRAVNANS
jgi:hypothetical protein